MITTIEIRSTTPWFPHSSVWPRWLRWIEYYVRVRIFKQRSYSIDLWTIEESQDVHAMHGIDLERELTKAFIREAEKEINDRSLKNR